MTEAEKQYARRDAMALDKEGSYYSRHVMAMTAEKLHAKSDIAAELAFRDAEIDRLSAAVQHEADCVEAAKAEIDRLTRERNEARAEREAMAKDAEAQ